MKGTSAKRPAHDYFPPRAACAGCGQVLRVRTDGTMYSHVCAFGLYQTDQRPAAPPEPEVPPR